MLKQTITLKVEDEYEGSLTDLLTKFDIQIDRRSVWTEGFVHFDCMGTYKNVQKLLEKLDEITNEVLLIG
ncbi:MAG: hypothetical protein J6B01_04380 [Ruminococcus sp.]|nr:hypothetical protein [Ruminococcus sp.]